MPDIDIATYLGLYEDKINEKDDKVMLYILVCKAFAVRTLGQSDTFAQ
jgi:hypothetical protein